MVNKAISELPQAQNVNNQDLFVIEQGGLAKKLPAETFITEQGIINALAEALDGHGGIQSVTLASVSGRIRTYRITFSDGSATTFQVYDGTSIERISRTSSSGLQDVYTIFMSDGTTTFFTVTNGADGTVSEAMLNDALKDKAPAITETTESSAIATFPDGADNMVMHHVVVEIDPVQSGSGDPSPSNIRPITGHTEVNVTRTGSNLLDVSNAVNATNVVESVDADGTIHFKDVSPQWGSTYIGKMYVKSGQTYIISANLTYGRLGFSNSTVYPQAPLNNIADVTPRVDTAVSVLNRSRSSNSFTANYTGNLYVFYCSDSNYSPYHATFSTPIWVNVGSTATAYEPYQGNTVTVDWTTEAGTVYGGTLDVATGLLTVDRAMVDMGTMAWGYESSNAQFYSNGIAGTSINWYNWSNTPPLLCSRYKPISNSQLASSDFCVGYAYNSKQLRVKDSTYTDAATFKTAMSGVQLVYELATPQTYLLTPQQLMTLLGTNNVWADTGNVSVTYPADTKMFIEKLTMPTEDDLVANQAITSGKYFMIGNSLYLALANIASGAAITIGTNAQRVSLADALNAINS